MSERERVASTVSQSRITAEAQPAAMDSDLSSLSQLTANIKAADKLSSVLDSTGVRREKSLHTGFKLAPYLSRSLRVSLFPFGLVLCRGGGAEQH